LIKQLLTEVITSEVYNFIPVESTGDYFFYKKVDGESKRFLAIIESYDLLSPLDYNANIEESVPGEIKTDPAFEKNTDLIILLKIDRIDDFEKFEKSIFLIEENPYYYKKYVLYYFSEEASAITGTKFSELSDLLLDREKFKGYKKSPKLPSAYSIAARFFIKLPFLEVPIIEGELDSVDTIYEQSLADNKLSEFDASLNKMLEKHQDNYSSLIEEYIDGKMESN